jgi:hypothetical protein
MSRSLARKTLRPPRKQTLSGYDNRLHFLHVPNEHSHDTVALERSNRALFFFDNPRGTSQITLVNLKGPRNPAKAFETNSSQQ